MVNLCMRPVLFIAVTAILTAACSSSQGLRVESLHDVLLQKSLGFEGERPARATLPHNVPSAPPTLGLYLKPTGFLQHAFEWTDRDREQMLAWAKELARPGAVAGISFVPQSSLKGDTLAELRASAARYRADLLLVVDGAGAVDRYNNYKAPLLYWTILGAYLADGTHSDALCLVRGSLWDVKSGSLLLREETEGRANTMGPAAFVDDNAVITEAKTRALGELQRRLEEQVKQLRSASSAETGSLTGNRNSRGPKRTADSAMASNQSLRKR